MVDIFELAKSGRAKCRKCKEKISKNELRFGLERVAVFNGNEVTSYHWYHFDCAMDKFPEKLAGVLDKSLLNEEQIDALSPFVNDLSKSGFATQDISRLNGDEGIVNIEGEVIRAMNPRFMENLDGSEKEVRIVYIKDSLGERGKVVLWNSVNLPINKGDKLILLGGKTTIGSDDRVEVHEVPETKIFLNEEPDIGGIEIYTSDAWEKPSNMACEFEIAPSSRASCIVCDEKITKDSLKIVKPMFMENETTKQPFAGKRSLHVLCVLKDEDGEEVLHEAVTRLTPLIVNEWKDTLNQLVANMKDCAPKELLSQLLRI